MGAFIMFVVKKKVLIMMDFGDMNLRSFVKKLKYLFKTHKILISINNTGRWSAIPHHD
jgi:hypothetical protein